MASRDLPDLYKSKSLLLRPSQNSLDFPIVPSIGQSNDCYKTKTAKRNSFLRSIMITNEKLGIKLEVYI